MSAPTLSELYGEAQQATQRLKRMLDAFRNPLGVPPILVEGLAPWEVETRYALAVEAEERAREAYMTEQMLLILPYPTSGSANGKHVIRAEFKALGGRGSIPTDTSAEILMYGVSELGLADYSDLQKECENLRTAEWMTDYELSIGQETAAISARMFSSSAIMAAKAHYAVRTILSTAPRLGFLNPPKVTDASGTAAGGAGAS
jgi:hypothetical protein